MRYIISQCTLFTPLLVWYDTEIDQELIDLINGDGSGNKAVSLSWTADGKGYFARLFPSKEWTGDLPDDFPHQIDKLRASVKNFDIGLKTILFGQGTSHIYVFERGFSAHLDGAAEDVEHPLHKASTPLGSVVYNTGLTTP